MHSQAVVLSLLLALAAPLRAETAQVQRETLERFMPYAGEPVREIRSFRYWNGRPLGREWFAVWTRPNDGVYLVRVELPCIGIDSARRIGISSNNTVVDPQIDRVTFDDNARRSCGIAEIRPVDFKRMRADDRAAGRVTPR